MQVTENNIPVATLPSSSGYGVHNIQSRIESIGVQQDLLMNYYNKSEALLKFSDRTITNVALSERYTKTESDDRYYQKTLVYTKAESNLIYATQSQITNLDHFLTRLNDEIHNDETGLDSKVLNNIHKLNAIEQQHLDSRVSNNTTKISTIESEVDNIESVTNNMVYQSGQIKILSRISFNDDISVRTDNPVRIHLGRGAILYNFEDGEADIPTKITSIENNAFFQTPNDNSGKSLKCDNVTVLRGSTYLPVLTSDDFRQLLINNVDAVSGTVQQNTVLIAGPNLQIPKSPNPIVFVDTDGRLGSSSLSESRYDDQVFGADGRGEDGNEADNNAQKFQHGLVPSFVSEVSAGSSGGTVRVGSSTHLLTASGTWRQLSDIFVENGVSTVSVSENLPDFQPITKNNQFALCSQVNGGTIFYADVDTSFISEHASRLYHTPARVNTLINTKIGDGSIANAVINHIESQTLTAVSDRRLKTNIKNINKNIENLEPVEFEYKNDKGKTRYGLIAQDVKTNYPELVETDIDGKLSIKYLDIIGLLIKDNQDLRKKINNIEKFLKIK
jgi:hypothetical protein